MLDPCSAGRSTARSLSPRTTGPERSLFPDVLARSSREQLSCVWVAARETIPKRSELQVDKLWMLGVNRNVRNRFVR